MSYHLKIKFAQMALINPRTAKTTQSQFCAEVRVAPLGKTIVIPANSLDLPALAVAKKGASPIHVFTALGEMCSESKAYDELETLIQVLEEVETLIYKILCDPKDEYQTYEVEESVCRMMLMYLKGLRPTN